MSTAAGGVPYPRPVLPPQRLGRQWTSVTACPHNALARVVPVTLATTASAVIRARVPSVYRSLDAKMAAGGCGQWEGCWGEPKAL